jgi:hypothetical protein
MDHRTELVDVIRRVRNRWRLKLAMRGAVVVVAGTVLALLLSASGLESFRFTAPAIIAFRVVTVGVFVGLLLYGLVWPLRRRVTDAQVAMYLEECDPTLEAKIISAVEATADGGSEAHSPRLVEKLVEQAIDQCRSMDHAHTVERTALQRHAASLAAIAAILALALAFGPAYLRHGMSALLTFQSAAASTPYKIEVRPGNTKVPRGADQAVSAKLIGFSSSDVTVMMRGAQNAAYDRVPLIPGKEQGTFEGMLFHLEKPTEYYVESNGVRSEKFTLSVVDLPTVQQMEMEYRFPAYTGLAPRKADGGDVAAIRGTEVVLRVTPTMTAPDGKIVLSDGNARPLTRQADGTLTGSFTIQQQGFYRIQLTGPHAEQVEASQQYTIDVIDDQAPSVHFTKPGRDTQASPVEELFLEARADDDYGVKSLQLFYSVNGSTPKSINLFSGRALTEVTGAHTIYLEELGLKPGDFVSYYAKASDTDAVQGSKTTTSDIYFVQIRPFKKDYKPAQSQAQMGGGGGGGGQQVGQLSQQQREIVAATFNIVRDKAKTKPEKYRENVVFLNLAQAKLREQVEELVQKLVSRLGAVDPSYNKIAEVLPKAAEEMKAAETELKGMKADSALSPEQRALKLLQEAEQQYELQVAQQQGGGGGGGGANSALAEDLADLFELELDKLANQYEMQQRAEQQQGDQQIDQLVEKLKELARRQQQEIERQRRMAQQGQSSGNSSASQRALADEIEQMKRQLQQLTRDAQQRQQLQDAIQKLQDAQNAMRQAAANGSKDGGAQANQALDRLREAQQRLERSQSGRGERDLQHAQRTAEELAQEQKDVASEVNGLDQSQSGASGKAQALAQRKEAMDAKVADLQNQLEKLANQMRRDEKDAARKLDEAAGSIRDKRIREKIRYTQRVLQQGAGSQQQYARGMEDDIGANLDALQRKIGEAAGAVGRQSKQDSLGRAADKTRDLVRGMESLDQRMRDRAQQARGQQNQQGKGQQGQQGKGQQGQQGQNGQQGSQGQRGGDSNGGSPNGGDRNGSPQNGGAYGGDARNWGGYGGGWYGYRWNPDDIRQFRNQWREWANDAEALRRQLQQAGMNPRDLDDVLRDLRQFENDRLYADPQGLEKLQAAAIEKLKKFEFSLRRKADTGNESLSLSGSDQVPEGFRQAIEEYYRSLAKKQQR